ncbi:MAG: hypothetical protein GC159_05475 [Phycisphaera sp.]|nr:hypothetical protein [Phycisphaera sp.]
MTRHRIIAATASVLIVAAIAVAISVLTTAPTGSTSLATAPGGSAAWSEWRSGLRIGIVDIRRSPDEVGVLMRLQRNDDFAWRTNMVFAVRIEFGDAGGAFIDDPESSYDSWVNLDGWETRLLERPVTTSSCPHNAAVVRLAIGDLKTPWVPLPEEPQE